MCACVCVCECVCGGGGGVEGEAEGRGGLSVCLSSIVCMDGFLCMLIMGFMGIFLCLVGCVSMIIWTPTVLSVLYACVLYCCICTCSVQLSMFHMERRSRNMLIIIFIIIDNVIVINTRKVSQAYVCCYHT